MIINKKDTLVWLLVITCFTKSIELFVKVGDVGIDVYSYTVMPAIFLYFIFDGEHFKKWFVVILSSFLCFQLLIKLAFSLDVIPLFKQILPIVFYYSSAYFTIRKYGPYSVFDKYVKMSTLIAIIGIIQYCFDFFGISIFVDAHSRLNSIMPEASHFAVVVIPAFIYLFINGEKIRAGIIGISIFLTFSSTAYLTLFFILIIFYGRKTIRLIAYLPVVFSLFFFLYLYVDEFQYRINDVFNFLTNTDLYSANITTFSFFSNLFPAFYSFTSNYLLGAGLGGHSEMYTQYWLTHDSHLLLHRAFGINSLTAHSLVIRLISELGLLGVSLYFWIFKASFKSLYFYKKSKVEYSLVISSLSIVIYKSFKLGGYFDYGLPIFVMIILFLYRKCKANNDI